MAVYVLVAVQCILDVVTEGETFSSSFFSSGIRIGLTKRPSMLKLRYRAYSMLLSPLIKTI